MATMLTPRTTLRPLAPCSRWVVPCSAVHVLCAHDVPRTHVQDKEKENSVKTLEEEEVRLLVEHVPAKGSSDDLVTTALRKLIQDAQARRRASLPGVLDKTLQEGICSAVPRVISSSDAQALFSLGLVLMDLAAFSHAAQVLARVAELRPRSAAAEHQRGLALAKSGDFDKALEAYQAAVRKDDKLAISYNNMGVLLAKLAKYDQVCPMFAPCLPHVCPMFVRCSVQSRPCPWLVVRRELSEW